MRGECTSAKSILWGTLLWTLTFSQELLPNGTDTTPTEQTPTTPSDAGNSSLFFAYQQPCNVSWSLNPTAWLIEVTWSGTIDNNDSAVTVNLTKVNDASTDCLAEVPVSKQVPFTDNCVLLDVCPYTEYRVDIDFPCPVDENSTSTRTPPDVPGDPKDLTAVNITSSRVDLTWEKPTPFVGPILRYSVVYKAEQSENRTEETDSTVFTASSLIPYTKYTFRVYAETEAGPGKFSELTVRTDVEVPGTPTNLSWISCTNTSVELTWDPPTIFVGPILHYIVEVSSEQTEDNETLIAETGNFTASNLIPFTTYAFRVCAETKAGRGNFSEELAVKTKIGVPPAPTNLEAVASNTSVSLSWIKPNISRGPIQTYRIYWNNSTFSDQQNTGSDNTAYLIDWLLPYVNYTFKVLAITEAGPGNWSDEMHVLTSVGVPHAPTWLRSVKLLNTSVTLEWNEPSPSTGPIDKYRILWQNLTHADKRDTGSNATFYKMEGLAPFKKYTFWVLGMTQAGPGNKSKPLDVHTEVGVPFAPTSLQPYGESNTSVSLRWIEPNISTGPILEYRVFWKNATSEGEEDTSKNITNHMLSKLVPYANYTFKVLAITKAGPGQWSDIVHVRTKVGVPYAPTALNQTSLTNTTVVLEWKKPEISTGPILEYRVHWRNSSSHGEFDFGTPNTSHELQHLVPYSKYSFKVLALTAAGPGEWSHELSVQTKEGVPTAPRHLRIDRTTNVSVWMSWTRPESIRAPELQYVVSWRVADRKDLAGDEETVIHGNVAKGTVQHVLTNLLPYTNYSIRVSAVTKAGRGPATDPVLAMTAVGIPRPPIIHKVSVVRRRTVRVRWTPEGPFPGPVTFSLQAWRYPDQCSGKVSAVVDKEVKESMDPEAWAEGYSTDVEGLTPFANYSFLVLLQTTATEGVNSLKSETIQLPPEASSEPLNVVADCSWSSTRAKVKWDPPRFPNGRITSYMIRYGIPDQQEYQSTAWDAVDPCSSHFHEIGGMRPEKRYRITVTAFVEGVAVGGKPGIPREICELPPGIPYLGNTSRLLATSDAPDRVVMEWTRDTFSDYMGAIVQYTVLVGREGSLGEPRSGKEADDILPPWTNFSSGASDFYQATPPQWNPFSNNPDPLNCQISQIEAENNRTLVRCTIGSQKHCLDNETYCNGPLEPDTAYEMKIRGFTTGGFIETQLIYARTGPVPRPSIAGTVAAAAVALMLLVALSGGCFVLKKKGLLQPIASSFRTRLTPATEASSCRDSGLEMQRGKTSRCIKTKHFAEHVRLMMSDSHLQFSQEFEALKYASPQLPCTVAESEDNRPKNRWMNIFPFDHSRVKLLPLCDEPGSDFINANYIPGFSSPREYIASQGPLPHTVDDFWRMVWEQSVTTIVMLTQCVERGKKKCEQYWPAPGEAQYYGDMLVTTISESMLSSYIIRVLRLKLGSYERQVKQMHFTHWPDFGCPESPEDLINFVNAVRDHLPRTSPGPIVVHCSAGVGRTGTFIAVDRLARQLRSTTGDATVDIYGTVLELRNHRTNMVQTEDQYIYIHLCVSQLIIEKYYPQTSGEDIYSNIGADKDTSM